jgi:hypothetical protein
VAFEDNALKHLDALLVPLDDSIVNAHSVADAKIGQIRTKKGVLDLRELG